MMWYSISVVIKEIEILVTVRYHIIPIHVTKQTDQFIPSTGEDTGRQARLSTVGM